LKEKKGLGDCPQGIDFVFEFKQKGSHAPLLTLFLKSKTKIKTLVAIAQPPFSL